MKISEDKVKYGTFKTLNKLPAKLEEKIGRQISNFLSSNIIVY